MLLSQLNPIYGGGNRKLAVMPTHLAVRSSTGAAPAPVPVQQLSKVDSAG